MKKLLLTTFMFLLTALILCGCAESANGVYTTLSDSFELSDEELIALSEDKLTINKDAFDNDGSDADIDIDADGNVISSAKKKAKSTGYILVSGICTWTKNYGYIVALVSAFVGIVIMRLARKSINIRRKALLILVIGIPVIVLVLMYGSAFLADSLR